MKRTLFDSDHDLFRASFAEFLQREAVPHLAEWDAAREVSRDFWRSAGANGFVGFQAPVELGGAGIDDFRFNAIVDEETIECGLTASNFALQNDLLAPYLLDLTNDEQKARWVPGFTRGELIAAIAMTEPATGSDLRGLQTVARRTATGWSVTGQKTFISSGAQADLIVTAAKVEQVGPREPAILLVVEADMPGFERGRKLEKVGRHAQDTTELFFDEVEVPAANVLGEAGDGMRQLMRNLPQERLSIAVTAVATAQKALRLTLAYVKERHAFGQPVGSFQANRHLLAELHTEVEIAQVYLDRCIEAHCAKELTAAEAASAKYWTTELEFKVCDACVQLHGGYGYMEEYEIARLWRDSRVQRIYGGTTQIMKEIVGRSLGL